MATAIATQARVPRKPRLVRLRRSFRLLGEVLQFAGTSIVQIPRSTRYMGQVWKYAAFIAIGSTPVALVLTYFTGSECSVEGYYSLSQVGAQSVVGVFNAICDTREITPLFFGFAVGAKVGCGLVAELGTMRVNEEIDALQIMSMPTRVYLVSTRMLACFLVLPFMYLLALTVSYAGSFVVQHVQIAQISDGAYLDYFWRFLNLQDMIFSMIKAVTFSVLIVGTAVYFGYNVTGGAVGIGKAVAKTMAAALVMVVVVNAVLSQVFWGNNPNLPIQF